MKKRFFNTAVAVAAALSLSVGAFAEAAAPGVSNPGWSGLPGGSDAVVGSAVVKGKQVVLGSDTGVLITGSAAAFGDATYVYLWASILEGEDITEEKAAEVKAVVDEVLAAYKPPMSSKKVVVNAILRAEILDQDGNEVQPKTRLTVQLPADKVSNIVAYITEDGKIEWYELDTSSDVRYMSFKAKHFSDYYFLTLDGPVVDSLLNLRADGGVDDGSENTTPAPSNPTPGGDATVTTTTPAQTTAPEAGTTTAPSADVTTAATDNGNNGGNGSGDVTGSDNGSGDVSVDDGNNSSDVGNDSQGSGSDKNQATGVVLAVIPAAIAAAAVVISKKRK